MASILKVDEMQGVTSAGDITITSEGGSATQSLQQGLAKQWGRINQDTPALLDSLNTSSLTDVGTGTHRFVFTNNMGNVNYACSVMNQAEAVARGTAYTNSANNTTSLVERFDIEDGSPRDASNSATITCGDLA